MCVPRQRPEEPYQQPSKWTITWLSCNINNDSKHLIECRPSCSKEENNIKGTYKCN